MKVKLENGELIPYPIYMFQSILKKQLELSYYAHIPIEDSGKLPSCDFEFIYESLSSLVTTDKKDESDKLILLSKAMKGAKLERKSSSTIKKKK